MEKGEKSMLVQTAFIECPPESSEQVAAALIDVVGHVSANEPETVEYIVLRCDTEGADTLFTTIEHFRNQAALDRHNASVAVAQFLDVAGPLLSTPITITLSTQIAEKTKV
ncbi:putative quinol monooxygenase [Blastomonas sp.]|uniref:putative quinol monooxygenase n=1 Tax=Blastomonas sp. TaxID=1909299 RepID=UPI003593B7A5